jgi:hypothetical protein
MSSRKNAMTDDAPGPEEPTPERMADTSRPNDPARAGGAETYE